MKLNRCSCAMVICFCASVAAFSEEGAPSVRKVLDHSHFPQVAVQLSNGTERHLNIEGVGEIRDPKYVPEVDRLLTGAWLQDDGTLMVSDQNGKLARQELKYCFIWPFSQGADYALLLLELGLVQPRMMRADFRIEKRTGHRQLCAQIECLPRQIEILRNKLALQQDKKDALDVLRSVHLHASAVVPLLREMINEPDGLCVMRRC